MVELERKFGLFIKNKNKNKTSTMINPVMEPRTTLRDKVYKDLGSYTWKPQLEKQPCQEIHNNRRTYIN